MRKRNLYPVLAALLLQTLSGCGTDQVVSSRRNAGKPTLTAIIIDGPPVVTVSRGETHKLGVYALDEEKNRINLGFQVTWQSEDTARAVIDANGVVTAGEILGQTFVVAETIDLRDTVTLWIQKPESELSTFDITLFFGDDVPHWWRSALDLASRRWERVIRDVLPAVDVAALVDYCGYGTEPPDSVKQGIERGARVYIYTSGTFREGTYVEVVGGPCINRGLPYPTTVLGVVVLNRDMIDGIPNDISYLAHHELGHALGLVGVVQGFQPPWLEPRTGLYRGRLGLFGHYLDTGRFIDNLNTNGAHWPFQELMGSTRSDRILNASIGALMDLGYPAAWYGYGYIAKR